MKCIVVNRKWAVVGVGETTAAAEEDFEKAVADYRETLEAEPKLTTSLAEFLDDLRAGLVVPNPSLTCWISSTQWPLEEYVK